MNSTCDVLGISYPDLLQDDTECTHLEVGTILIIFMLAFYGIIFIVSMWKFTENRDERLSWCYDYNKQTCGCTDTGNYNEGNKCVLLWLMLSGAVGIVGAIIGFSTGQGFVLGWFGFGLPLLAFCSKVRFDDDKSFLGLC